jgi:hypothetical protein
MSNKLRCHSSKYQIIQHVLKESFIVTAFLLL